MKRFTLVGVAAVLVSFTAVAEYVQGYTRRDGTYVQPHFRTDPDSNRLNNWSTQGNVNPHTGQAGTASTYPPSNNYGGSTGYPAYNPYGNQRR